MTLFSFCSQITCCFSELKNACLNSKQRRPWSDCFFRSSLIWVCTVCLGLICRQLVFKILEHLLYCACWVTVQAFVVICWLFLNKWFPKFIQEHYQIVKLFGSRSGPTFCRSWSGSKLFANVISRQQESPLAQKELKACIQDLSLPLLGIGQMRIGRIVCQCW